MFRLTYKEMEKHEQKVKYPPPRNLSCLKSQLLVHKKSLYFCIVSVFIWGLLAHGYGILHNNLSHDVLNAFVATPTEERWKIELGRFLVPLYRIIFRGDGTGAVSLPWLIGMLGLAWTSVALCLVTRIFDIRSKLLVIFAAGIMTTNITNIAQIATYLYEFDVNCFSLMLSILAVYLWNRDKGIASFLVGSFCIMASIGLYQAYFAVTVTLIVGKSILDLLENKEIRPVFFHGLKGILMILAGGILYLLLGKLIFGITGITPQSRTDALNMGGQNPILVYLRLLKPAILYLARNILHVAYRSKGFFLLLGLVLSLCVVSVIRMFAVNKFRRGRIVFILFLAALMPFAMSSVAILAKGQSVHDLTKYAIWFFYFFLALYAFQVYGKTVLSGSKIHILLRATTGLLICIILWQNVILANTAYVKKETEANSTLSTMTRVVSQLEQREDYIPGETPIAFIGSPQHERIPYGMNRASTLTGLKATSAFTTDNSLYFYNAYKAYFAYVLQTPALFCTDEIHQQLKQNPQVQMLPTFPQKGYMQMIDGVLVIKMGN